MVILGMLLPRDTLADPSTFLQQSGFFTPNTSTHKTSTYNKHCFGIINIPVCEYVRASLSVSVFYFLKSVLGILHRANHQEMPTVQESIEIKPGARGGWFRTFPSGKKIYYRIARDL